MISRKKRLRYKQTAYKLSREHNLEIDLDNWDNIWDILDKYTIEPEPTYVYVIGEAGGTEVKIGKSKQPGYRLKQLQSDYPNKLYLWCYCKETLDINEKTLHKICKTSKILGEWYLLTEEVRRVIELIKKHRT